MAEIKDILRSRADSDDVAWTALTRIEALESALKPFADLYERVAEQVTDDMPIGVDQSLGLDHPGPHIQDVRLAAELLGLAP